LLERLLEELNLQRTDGLFTYSVVVVDNDHAATGRKTVEAFRQRARLPVQYHIEPEQNIALARNKAVRNAKGDFIAFVDDDEFPGNTWLLELLKALKRFEADGILGPVLPHYETRPPEWILKGRLHERPSHVTGTALHWTQTRSGNVLLRRDLFDREENRFDPAFGRGGEDTDFFRRMTGRGRRFLWCAEAPVFEVVPPERCTRSYLIRRALLRGKIPYNQTLSANLKSLAALPVYTALLPLLFIARPHLFMKYVIKVFDHAGRVLAYLGFDVIKEKYVLK
jgi:glycosyltransferase involved in cell wall biosynthesis